MLSLLSKSGDIFVPPFIQQMVLEALCFPIVRQSVRACVRARPGGGILRLACRRIL